MFKDTTDKDLKFTTEAQSELLRGVNVLADAVKVTMGPRGKNVVIENPSGYPILTKDGVTVARAVNLSDKFANLGVQMIKEAASRTAESAGDGTTTATVLTQAIFSEGIRMISSGHPIDRIKEGIEVAVKDIVKELGTSAIPVSNSQEIVQVGTISANGEEKIGELISQAMEAVGRDGVVTVEEAKGFQTTLSVVDGVRLNRGYMSPYFINDENTSSVVLENPVVLVSNRKISTMKELLPILEKIAETKQPILIIGDDFENEAMQGLVVNVTRGNIKACAIRAPGLGEHRHSFLDDLATLLGTKIITQADTDIMSTISLDDLGRCKRAVITRTSTTLVDCEGNNEKIEDRIADLRSLATAPGTTAADRSVIDSRLSKLSSGIAILRVGGATEMEMGERKDRVDDALNATQAAVEEGIVPGGGVALVRASQNLNVASYSDELHPGVGIVKTACKAPLIQIVKNTGGSSEVVIHKVLTTDDNIGFDAKNGQYLDMFEAGIIDPVKVVRCALENAASSAVMMLSVGCAMVEEH
ncbi:chaperonin GroEL [bacterium]|nr:chaperonin GroEL [bacterium]